MKKQIFAAALIVLTLACTKTKDVTQAVTSSEFSNLAGSDCKTHEWLTDKHEYPKTKRVTYRGCKDEYNRSNEGSKVFTYNVAPEDAIKGNVVKYYLFEDGFKVFYADSSYKTISGGAAWTLQTHSNSFGFDSYKVEVAKTTTDESANVQDIKGTFFVDYMNTAGDIQKTGHSRGIGKTNAGNYFKTTITDPLIKLSNYKYPVKGVVSVIVSESSVKHTQVLNYGNGEMDNKATLSVDDHPTEIVNLPLESWAEYLGE